MRDFDRTPEQIRPVEIIPNYIKHPDGSVLICCGDTKVICACSAKEGAPSFIAGSGKGWLTAEYSLLPSSTHTRSRREATKGKQGGRTLEIQRLIGRALRAAVDLDRLGEVTLTVDCDVIQADGGTRTASITGGFVATALALHRLQGMGVIHRGCMAHRIGAISAGVVDGGLLLDLNYDEDSRAQVDMNFVMNGSGKFIEVQGTAEHGDFDYDQLTGLAKLAQSGIEQLFNAQHEALGGILDEITRRDG